ncbi:MAG: lysophospholipid acyltransferase family protein [Polyangia bacterium]|jgi:putative hemolysin
MSVERPGALIDLRSTIRRRSLRALFSLVEPALDRMLGIGAINRVYAQALATREQERFFPAVLRAMDVNYLVSDAERARIPSHGAVIVVANHPFGGIDGLILGDILTRARRDARILANQLLLRIPEIRPWIIAVDADARPSSARANIRSMRRVIRWTRDGGLIGIFPSGTVSHLRLGSGVHDPAWHPNVAALVRMTGATVVPIYFEGQNSLPFQLAGLLHPGLRTLLLAAEAAKRRHSTVRVRVGCPLTQELASRYPDDEALIQYLRRQTYALRASSI